MRQRARLRCVLLGVFASAFVATTHAAELEDWPGGATPSLVATELNGERVNLAAMKGRIVIVNFWATWCEPCVAEMPSLQQLRDRHAGKIAVLAVNLGENETQIRKFAVKHGLRLPLLLDTDGAHKMAWNVKGVPASFVLAPDGKLRYYVVGQVDFSDEEVEAQILSVIPKPPSGKPASKARADARTRKPIAPSPNTAPSAAK